MRIAPAARAAPLLPALLAALLAAACSGRPPLEVTSVAVASTPGAERLAAAGVGADALRADALRALGEAAGFVPQGRSPWRSRRCTAQVIVGTAEVLVAQGGAAPVAQVDLLLEVAPAGERARREGGRAAEPVGLEPGGLRKAVARAARAALERAVATLALGLAAEDKGTSELVSDLASPDAPARLAAVRALADRGEHGAVPALLSALRDADPAVVEAAVGGLAQLRDQRAAPALIELARRRSGPEAAALARILGDIGGPDAHAWLVTMASGHPDAQVREAAGAALAELDARPAGTRPAPAR